MPNPFQLSVVAPDRSVVEETVVSVVAPGQEGYFGVQAGHVPMISALRPGILEFVDTTNNRHFVYMGGGFAEVAATRVTVLADEAQLATEIDVTSAENALENSRRALRGEDSTMTTEDAVIEVERAINRMKAARLVNR
jgi:F-type H+-transporting ATPase subunit epsilon